MDNVVDFKPPGPPPAKPPKTRKRVKLQREIERALMSRQDTVNQAAAILDLIDDSQPSMDMSWEQWNALLMSVSGARELLRNAEDLADAEALAKAGAALLLND